MRRTCPSTGNDRHPTSVKTETQNAETRTSNQEKEDENGGRTSAAHSKPFSCDSLWSSKEPAMVKPAIGVAAAMILMLTGCVSSRQARDVTPGVFLGESASLLEKGKSGDEALLV